MEEENFNFEWIEENKNTRYGKSFVSINPKNKIMRFYISSKAMDLLVEENGKEEIEYIKVGIDKNRKLLAIKPIPKMEKGAIKLNNGGSNNSNNSTCFTSKVLINEIKNYIYDGLKRYEVKYIDEMNILLVDLNTGVGESERL